MKRRHWSWIWKCGRCGTPHEHAPVGFICSCGYCQWPLLTKDRKKRIYVAGLYSRNPDGSVANVTEVLGNIRAGQLASLRVLQAGFYPFCPWFDYQFALLDDQPISKETYQANSMAWLEVSDAVLVISGEGIGSGVDAEIARAKELLLPIFRSLEALINAEHP